MPKIPFATGQSQQGPQASPFQQSRYTSKDATAEGLTKLGTTMSESAMYLAKVDEAEQKAQFHELRQNVRYEMAMLQETFKERTDYQKFEEDYQKSVDEIKERLKGDVRPDVWNRAASVVDAEFNRGAAQVRYLGWKLRNKDLEGKTISAYQKGIVDYVQETDPQIAEMKKSDIIYTIKDAQEGGWLNPVKAQKMIDDIDIEADTFRAARDIEGTQAPEQALSVYKMLQDPKNYPNLEPMKRITFQKEARSKALSLYEDFERKEKELREDTLVAAYAMLDDPTISMYDKKTKLDKWTERDPVTGIRPMSPTMANSLKNQLEKGDMGEIDWATYETIRSAIAERKDVRPMLDDAITKGKITRTEARLLLDKMMTYREMDRREAEAERRRRDAENRQIQRIEKAEEKARTAEFLRTQQDIIRDIKTYFIEPAFKEYPQIVGYMMATIEKQVKMFPVTYDLTKMREDTENLALRLIEYGNSGTKAGVLNKFKEQYMRDVGLKPDITKPQEIKKTTAAESPKKINRPKTLPVGWTEKNGKVYNDKGKEMQWVED